VRMFAGMDVSFKQTAVCVVDEAGSIAWGGGHASRGAGSSAAAVEEWLADTR
jgi:hypothetical protein